MPAPSFLIDYANVAEPRLGAFLAAKAREFERVPVDLRDAFSLLRDYLLRGGKRLRGALVLLGCEAAGGDPDEAIDPSIGLELLHAYLLIHDDFMDQDDTRRGGPTLHRALGGDHLADSIALLCGSLCEAWAYQLLPGRVQGAVAAVMEQVILGQMADLRAPRAAPLSAEAILDVQQRKTGSYTFELPLTVGAMLAGADDKLLRKLSAYAGPLGVAFQIADDLLGSFGAPEVTGKPSGNDLREGKRTLLVARALEMATPADAEKLRQKLGQPDADVEALRDILRRSGAVDAARAEADQLCRRALQAVDSLPAGVRDRLAEIARYTVVRAT
ncbi:MAG TPA: polyprenyl synthetase family protein [Myxococcales bacterium]|nr:polyprenyl synthetase family protein [Myxococcales bacterium]